MAIRSRYDQISSVEIKEENSYLEDVTKYGSTHVSQNIGKKKKKKLYINN
jgi:hypothetical protein